MTSWMVLGSSPTAPTYHSIPEVDYVIASGDGIMLRDPDFYMMIEKSALHRHIKLYYTAQQRGHTKILITDHIEIYARQAKYMDKLVKLGLRDANNNTPIYNERLVIDQFQKPDAWELWKPGNMFYAASGIMALQYAINQGANEIHMVGLEGYNKEKEFFYFNSEDSAGPLPNVGSFELQAYSHKLTQKMVDLLPDVSFITYGSLNFTLTGQNVRSYALDGTRLVSIGS